MTAIQNLALAVGQLTAGALRDWTGNFTVTGIFLAGLGAVAMVLGRRARQAWNNATPEGHSEASGDAREEELALTRDTIFLWAGQHRS